MISREYVEARRVLLDALEALGANRSSVILVGAQAVYMRAGAGDLHVAPYTTDSDLVIDPELVREGFSFDACLVQAGFAPGLDVEGREILGTWVTSGRILGKEALMGVDLLVPEAVGGGGRRAARLMGQSTRLARKARGLELALVDHDPTTVAALDPEDRRTFVVEVAGPSALLVAKMHKIRDRIDDPKRSRDIDKDALDVLRLLRGVPSDEIAICLADALTAHLAGSRPAGGRDLTDAVRTVTESAVEYMTEDFSAPTGAGCLLAERAAAGQEVPGSVAASLAALVRRLLARVSALTP